MSVHSPRDMKFAPALDGGGRAVTRSSRATISSSEYLKINSETLEISARSDTLVQLGQSTRKAQGPVPQNDSIPKLILSPIH